MNGCPFEKDNAKMSIQQYILAKDLSKHYTLWVDTADQVQEDKKKNTHIRKKNPSKSGTNKNK